MKDNTFFMEYYCGAATVPYLATLLILGQLLSVYFETYFALGTLKACPDRSSYNFQFKSRISN